MVTFKPSGPVRLLRLWPPVAMAGPTCLVLVTRPAPGPATLRRPPSSVGRRVIPKAHPSSHPSCHSQLLAGLQLRGHTWAWLPHMPRCHVESGGKPLHALVGIWGGGPGGPSPCWIDDSRSPGRPFSLVGPTEKRCYRTASGPASVLADADGTSLSLGLAGAEAWEPAETQLTAEQRLWAWK